MLKGGSFLTHKTNPQDVFISKEWTEEQKMIGEMVKDFCVTEISEPMQKRGYELDAGKHRDEIVQLLEKAAELGLCGVAIPERFGGIDLDFNTGVLFSEAVAHGFSFATTIGAQTSIGSLPIVYYGTEEQKQKYLPGVADGSLKAAYCLTEPSAGSDANSGKTKAVLNKGGTHYLLSGQKMWITNGGFADLFIVFAKIDDDEKLSAFIVEKSFGGITVGAEEKKLGIKGSSTVQLFFDECQVPVENLLSKRESGFKIALNILNSGRIKLAAGATGGCKFAIEKAANYANERKQFGVQIGSFGAIQHKIGEMTARTYACDAAIYRTSANIDKLTKKLQESGSEVGESKLKAIREFAVECAILKVKGSENIDYVIDEALQIYGGMGYSVETGIEMGYRDARITRIYEGTNEINRMLSVAELTKRAIKTKEIDLHKAGKSVPGTIFKARLFGFSSARFAAEERVLEHLKALFLFLSGTAGKKLGKKLVDEQEMVMNFSDILAEVYILDSVLAKVKKLSAQKEQGEEFDVQMALLKVYTYEAIHTAKKAAFDAISAYETGFTKRTHLWVVNQLTQVPNYNGKELRRKVAKYILKVNKYPY